MDEDERGNVVDPATGLPKVLNRKCDTCIFRTNSTMKQHLRDGTIDSMVEQSNANGSWITCHSTLPTMGVEVGEQAICRGYWDVHRFDSWGCKLAISLGGPVFVDQESNSE